MLVSEMLRRCPDTIKSFVSLGLYRPQHHVKSFQEQMHCCASTIDISHVLVRTYRIKDKHDLLTLPLLPPLP